MWKPIQWQNLSCYALQDLIDRWPLTGAEITEPKNNKVMGKVKKQVKIKSRVPKTNPRQRHQGQDGEIRYLEHRGVWIGFWGGRVVVTKKTQQACQEFLDRWPRTIG